MTSDRQDILNLTIDGDRHRKRGGLARTHCSKGHSLADAYVEQRANGSTYRRCKVCCLNSARAWQEANPERRRELQRRASSAYSFREDPDRRRTRHYQKKFGCSFERIREMWEAQSRCCRICTRAIEFEGQLGARGAAVMKKTTAVVDHDHRTGAIRGILCVRCNSVLGYIDDDPARARRAAEYLEASR